MPVVFAISLKRTLSLVSTDQGKVSIRYRTLEASNWMRVSDQLVKQQIPKKRRAVVFDIDNTLTPPRRPLEAEMANALINIEVPFFLSAGGDLRLASEQFIEPLHAFGFRGSFDAFLCNGPTRYHCDIFEQTSVKLLRHFEMRDHLGEERFIRFLRVIETALDMHEFRLPAPLQ